MSEKMIPETPERFCVDCEYYFSTEKNYYSEVCWGRPDAIELVTGIPHNLRAEMERSGERPAYPMAKSYEPCGPEGRHWKPKDA